MTATNALDPAIPNAGLRQECNDTTGRHWLDQRAWIDKQMPPLDVEPWTAPR
jgi:hypothetical protein